MPKLFRLCAALALMAAALGADTKALRPQGYVSDFAGVVDPAAREELARYCAAVERATGAQISLVTLPSLEGEPIEDAANNLFRAWGVGPKGTNEGIMLLLVTGERRSRMEVGYGLEPYIPDGFAGSVLREMRPALREERYGDALAAAAQTIGSRIAAAKGVSIGTEAPRSRPRGGNGLPWPLLLGGGLLLLFLLMQGRGNSRYGGGGGGGFLTGLLLGGMMGRSGWGGRSSGGFGGFDSGDSFGGFGGGDSGGGGASSDW
jgi:uncharacterized protein